MDLLVFLAAFSIGLLLYFVLRSIGAPQILVTSAVVMIMVLYAAGVSLIPRLRVRLDQAGDNAYYLGLLFTLTSMAVALWEFGTSPVSTSGAPGETGVESIISNFGIALATTIAGIFLRILLNQMRVDPADIERVTRLELAESAQRIKSTLDQVAIAFERYMDENRQRSEDVLSRFESELKARSRSFEGELAALSGESAAASRAHLEQHRAVLDETATSVRRISAHAIESIKSLNDLHTSPKLFAAQLAAVSEQTEKLNAGVASAVARLSEISTTSQSGVEELSSLTASLSRSVVATERAQAQAASLISSYSDHLSQEQHRHSGHITSTLSSVTTALESVTQSATAARGELTELHTAVMKSAKASEQAQQNAQMVIESLITMTDSLVTQVKRA